MTTTHRGLRVSQLTEFVGRDSELAALRDLVTSRRLVTITGEAGVGKSRIAARLAEVLRRSLGGSTVLVAMAGVDPGQTAATIAAVLQIQGSTVLEVARELGDRPYLIVLDDLADPKQAAGTLEELLAHTTETRIVVTSRGRAAMCGETTYVLSPLALPSPEALQQPAPTALQSPAGSLLLRRIIDSDPTFTVTKACVEDMLTVCRATDGLPRLIEAAARAVRDLSAKTTATAVTEDPGVLNAFLPPGRADLSTSALLDDALNHVSLSATALAQRLSLFASGCDLQFAAELFAGASAAKIAVPAAELVEHSLVRTETAAGEQRLCVPLHYRHRLLATWEGPERAEETRRVHDAFLERLRAGARDWFTGEQLSSIQFLNRHAADITALISEMVADPACAREALEIISDLRHYWQLHPVDPWPRVRDWLETAVSLDSTRDALTVRAMQTDAYIAFHEGDLQGARAQLLAVTAEIDSELLTADEELFGDFLRAMIDLAEGDLAAAKPQLLRVLRVSIDAGNLDHLGEKYWHLATCQIAANDHDGARATLAEAAAHCGRVGDLWGGAYIGCLQAIVADRDGHRSEAVTLVRDSVATLSDFGDRVGLALCVRLLAVIAVHSGDDANVAQFAVLLPQSVTTRPPLPLPDLRLPTTLTTELSASLPDERSLSAVLGRIIDGEDAAVPQRPVGPPSVLSARENEVALLIAEGLGNPAIAARLVLSRRTVEGHVQRILAKLGFRSRSQIAVWATQHQAPAHAHR